MIIVFWNSFNHTTYLFNEPLQYPCTCGHFNQVFFCSVHRPGNEIMMGVSAIMGLGT